MSQSLSFQLLFIPPAQPSAVTLSSTVTPWGGSTGDTSASGTTFVPEPQKIQHFKANQDLVPPHTPCSPGDRNCSAACHPRPAAGCHLLRGHSPGVAALPPEPSEKSLLVCGAGTGHSWAHTGHRAAHANRPRVKQSKAWDVPAANARDKREAGWPQSHCQSQSSPWSPQKPPWHCRSVPGTGFSRATSQA